MTESKFLEIWREGPRFLSVQTVFKTDVVGWLPNRLGLEGRVIFGLNSCLQDKGRGLSIFMRTGLGPGALDSRFYHVGRIRWTPSYREERGKNRKEIQG